ncbi:hypothetical protein VNI00_012366 [Paramarasmius palmivorus]|uniref:Uncharacterized protein n=1 Tax=Paramarasmius palmivorus TaxID=297713 RepID=A0AAW0C7S9_9AGAR
MRFTPTMTSGLHDDILMSQRPTSQGSNASRRQRSRNPSRASQSSASPGPTQARNNNNNAPRQTKNNQRGRGGGGGKSKNPLGGAMDTLQETTEKTPLLGDAQGLLGKKGGQDGGLPVVGDAQKQLMSAYDEAKMLEGNLPEMDAIKGSAAEDAIKLRLEVNLDVVVTLRATVHGDLTVSLL